MDGSKKDNCRLSINQNQTVIATKNHSMSWLISLFELKNFPSFFYWFQSLLKCDYGTVFFSSSIFCDFTVAKISEPEKCDTIELDGFTRNKTKTKANSMEESKPKWKIVSYRTTNENTHKMIFGVEESEWNFVFVGLHQVYWNFENGSLQFN